MASAEEEQWGIEDINQQLKQEGVDTTAPVVEQLCCVWRLFLQSREELRAAAGELQKLEELKAEEMREVENYVGHVRSLTEARDALAAQFERENQQLRMEFTQLQLEQESQRKEVEEILEQENLLEIAHSTPSEQVTYLLVERSTLFEKIQELEQKLGSLSCLESLYTARLQSHAEELARESALHKGAEKDLDETTRSLQMAYSEIQSLTRELDVQKEKAETGLSVAETLKGEVRKEKAQEFNLYVEEEVLALRNRIGAPVSEARMFSDQDKTEAKAEEETILDEATSDNESNKNLHHRCRRVIEAMERQNSQLLHKLCKLEKEDEDLVERNEELESLLGAAQNRIKGEQERFECEVGELQRKVSELTQECEKLKQMAADEKKTGEKLLATRRTCTELLAKERILEDKLSRQGEEKKQLCAKLSESNDKLEELEKQVKRSQEEKKLLQKENAELRKDIRALQHQFSNTMTEMKTHEELSPGDSHSCKPPIPMRNNNDDVKQSLPEEKPHHVQQAELEELRQEIQQVQHLSGRAEEELQHERERNLELKKSNIFLQQENIKIKAELLKLSGSSKLRAKETQLARKFAELQVQCQQQEARLQVLEDEKKALFDEHLQCQKYNQKLAEQVQALQTEKETLLEEFGQILKQVDISVRKHNDRCLRHKAKLRRAKEAFISGVKQRDWCIRNLEDDVKLAKCQVEKDRLLICQVTTENEGLLQEKRKLFQQVHDLAETERNSKQALSTVQSRARLLDEENQRLHERILQLTSHIGNLESALRSIRNHSLEELKSIGFSGCQVQSKILSLPSARFSVASLSDFCGPLKAVDDGKLDEPVKGPPLLFQPLEIGYLNMASLSNTSDFLKEKPSQHFFCDHG